MVFFFEISLFWLMFLPGNMNLANPDLFQYGENNGRTEGDVRQSETLPWWDGRGC